MHPTRAGQPQVRDDALHLQCTYLQGSQGAALHFGQALLGHQAFRAAQDENPGALPQLELVAHPAHA